jgi:hypothetical protein
MIEIGFQNGNRNNMNKYIGLRTVILLIEFKSLFI